MARKKSKSRSARQRSTVVLILVLVLSVYFLLTGADPFGLFTVDELPNGPTAPELVGRGGDFWQVYFTSPGQKYDPENLAGTIPAALIERINAAEKSIDIAAFEFNLAPVAAALVAARARGVEIRWITDDEFGIDADEEDGDGLFALLEDAGVGVKDDGRAALMHNKFLIFDDETVWTGSTNLTVNGTFRNNNNVLILESPDVAAIYSREFDEMWGGEFGPRSPATVDAQSVVIEGTPVQVLFGPEDEVISELVSVVEEAQASIDFLAFSFTHDDLGAAVLERANAGVAVRGVFETRGSETEFSELLRFYCAGLAVRQDGNPGVLHHKVLVIDGQTVVTGSFNFSENADSSNDENVVIISNGDIADQYLQEVDRRWTEATDPDSAEFSCSQ